MWPEGVASSPLLVVGRDSEIVVGGGGAGLVKVACSCGGWLVFAGVVGGAGRLSSVWATGAFVGVAGGCGGGGSGVLGWCVKVGHWVPQYQDVDEVLGLGGWGSGW